MLLKIVSSVVAALLVVSAKDLFALVKQVVHHAISPLRVVKSPKADALIMGHFSTITNPDTTVMHHRWVEEYGNVMTIRVLFNLRRLFVVDPRAISHVLNHASDYPKPRQSQEALIRILGAGLVVVEGETHRRERRIMSPAFGIPQIRDLTNIFLDKSAQLRDLWVSQVRRSNSPSDCVIEASSYINKMTLDVIGLAGFNYKFDALNPTDTPTELNQAFRELMTNDPPSTIDLIQMFLPWTRKVYTSKSTLRVKKARRAMDKVGLALIADMKAAVRASAEGAVGRKDFENKDLLSLLIRANMANDVPDSNRMSDDEVIAQIPTFLFAGHETTSSTLSSMLYALACNQDIQNTLRNELLACKGGDRPDMDELNNLPYLDTILRETLRLYPPVPLTSRAAEKDDVIPTEREWTDAKGVRRSGIPVKKDDVVLIPILAINTSKEIWGEDSYEFKPERWANLPEAASSIPGIWGNSLSFYGGSRACIGYRFSVMETKATIYTLLRTLRFELAVDRKDICIQTAGGITRPVMQKEGSTRKQARLPLQVSLVETD